MRVLHIIGGDDTGGAMSYLLPLLTALRAQGCDARLLCLGGGGLAEAAAARSLPCTVAPMSHAWDLRALAPLRRGLAAGDAGRWDVVHTHGMRANLPVRILLPTLPGRPLLFTTVHSDMALDYSSALKSRGYGLLDRATRPAVDGFCCVSARLARTLVARGVPAGRVHVVHAGLELDRLGGGGGPSTSAAPRSGAEGAAAGAGAAGPVGAGVPAATPLIGTVARLVPVKDLGLLLEAVALVAREIPDTRLVIVGEGPERAALERRAAEADLTGRVEFLGRVVPAWPALSGAQVFALSSESEGLPISVLEAMALGLAVVATDVGGLAEAVQDGKSGFLVQRTGDRQADAASLAARLLDLLRDPDLRRRFGEAGMKRVAEQFSSDAAGRLMLSIYQDGLAAAPRHRART